MPRTTTTPTVGASIGVAAFGAAVCQDLDAMVASTTLTPAAPAARVAMTTTRAKAASAVVGNVVYVIGGTGSVASYLTTNEAYDASTNTWTSKAAMTTGRHSACAAAVGTVVYVIGGVPGAGSIVATNEAYDTVANSWSTKTSSSASVMTACAVAVGTLIYQMGGEAGGSAIQSVVNAYDTVGNAWTAKTSLPVATACAGSTTHNGRIYFMGGALGAAGATPTSACYVYDPTANFWSSIASIPSGGRSHGPIAALLGGVIWLLGGGSSGNQVDYYNPVLNTWTTMANAPTARFYPAGGVANNLLMLIGGGTTSALAATLTSFDAAQLPTAQAATTSRLIAAYGVGNQVTNLTLGQAGPVVPVKSGDTWAALNLGWSGTTPTAQTILTAGL
jgi:N-acetylneuraminic acid mutarotase